MGLVWVYGLKHGEQHSEIVHGFAERVLRITSSSNDVYLESKCLWGMALHRLTTGRHEEARGFGQRILDLGRQAADPRTVAMGLYALAWVNAFSRFDDAIEQAEESFRLSPDPADKLTARAVKGVALVFMGRGQEGLEKASERGAYR
jgi:tetratricopeptide (TPR) repeat protein